MKTANHAPRSATPESSKREPSPDYARFTGALDELHDAVVGNQNAGEGDSLGDYPGAAEYQRIAQELDVEGRPLHDYEEVLVEAMRSEAQFNTAQSHVNLDALDAPIDGDDTPRTTRIQAVIDQLTEQIDAATDQQQVAKLKGKRTALKDFLTENFITDASENPEAVAQYLKVAQETAPDEHGDATAERQKYRTRRKATKVMEDIINRNSLDAAAYEVLAEYYPVEGATPGTELVPVERVGTPGKEVVPYEGDTAVVTSKEAAPTGEVVDPAVEAARGKLDSLREQLAELNARREKSARNYEGDLAEALRSEYKKTLRELYKLENSEFLDDPNISNAEKLKSMSMFTTSAATDLEMATVKSGREKKSPVGKMIDWYGRRSKVMKIVIGVGASAMAGVVTAGAGAAVVSGTLFAANLEAKRRQMRAEGTLGVDLIDGDALARNYIEDDDWGDADLDLNTKNIDTALDDMINSTDQRSEKFIKNEQKRRQRRIIGGVAVGAVVGGVSMGVLDGVMSGDAVQAAPAEVAPSVVDAPAAMAEFGPSTVMVNPGDGFYNVFQSMGIPEAEWTTILDKVGPELLQSGDAYTMLDGTPGISAPGQLSQTAFEAIMRARG